MLRRNRRTLARSAGPEARLRSVVVDDPAAGRGPARYGAGSGELTRGAVRAPGVSRLLPACTW